MLLLLSIFMNELDVSRGCSLTKCVANTKIQKHLGDFICDFIQNHQGEFHERNTFPLTPNTAEFYFVLVMTILYSDAEIRYPKILYNCSKLFTSVCWFEI